LRLKVARNSEAVFYKKIRCAQKKVKKTCFTIEKRNKSFKILKKNQNIAVL
jgi:hypothetical protein